jgi:hypothetical protein
MQQRRAAGAPFHSEGAPALRGETLVMPLNCARRLVGEGSEDERAAARRGHVDSCKRDLAAAAFN